MKLDAHMLLDACGDAATAAGISIRADLVPLAGEGAPVKPAVYEGGTYQEDRRWIGDGEDRRQVQAVVLDNVPSQANRLEAALRAAREQVGLPELWLDLSELPLPEHLPGAISSFQLPHRNADAYLRDAELDGVAFLKTEVGKAVFAATAANPTALYEWMPQALLFGFWQSHLGKKRQQTKLARSWVSEIVGYEPATLDTKTKGLKGDPLNLSIEEGLTFLEDDQREWTIAEGKARRGKSGDSLAGVGHGQVPVAGAPAGVSFRSVRQQATVSLAGLRRIGGPSPQAAAAGRALLVAIGLLAHVDAFGRAFTLRSGCDLRPASASWRWLGETEDVEVEPLAHQEAVELVRACAAAAEQTGLPVGERWPRPQRLTPRPSLRAAIEKTWPPVGDA